ncbi:acylphosphatase-2 [Bemisia tabaci]|uniref:acylphosphatase-2 n=1 Tax=Bemisia tabaci TaxID=7038 RepID=UPI0008F9BA98|nr:PREDICTED: acylphosphatase-2 [Bemisia tabaci]
MGAGEELSTLVSVEFEVFGHVQGVYFTKYARDRCLELGLAGWIKNSKRGTIVGKMQGEKSKVEEMVSWLSKTGSPGSQIERCDLMNFEYIARQEFRGFSIRF